MGFFLLFFFVFFCGGSAVPGISEFRRFLNLEPGLFRRNQKKTRVINAIAKGKRNTS
jgi:hypothetical protein